MARKRSSHHRQRQASRTTLLIVGEGADDQAFIKHMHQQLRASRDIRPKIEKQSGGSPGNIIDNAARKYTDQDFDQRFIVLDSDIALSQQERDRTRKYGFRLILWSPTCLEGALLEVLGERVNDHETAQQLKDRLHPRLVGHHTEKAAYAVLFPREVLEAATNPSVAEVRTALAGQLI